MAKMVKSSIILCSILFMFMVVLSCNKQQEPADQPVDYVDPMIGSGGHGHVFVGANVPFGAVQVGPNNIYKGWDWCSGYHHSDSLIIGFSQLHLSGTGIGDLADILIMPFTGEPRLDKGKQEYPHGGYLSTFSHENEIAKPGYYSVTMDNGVNVGLAATERVGIHRYHFPRNEEAHIIIDLKEGISPVSSENALANIEAEIPDWDFDRVVADAREKWNNELSKISIESENNSDKRIFYTSLYHAYMHPSLYNDHLGDYRGADNEVYTNRDFDNYTIFSTWDTYRAAHPLFTITQPDRVNDIVNSMLAIYDQQEYLPIWHLHGYETKTMVGISSIQVIAEAYLKGFRGFDAERAFEAIKTTSMLDIEGLNYLREMRPIPYDAGLRRTVAQAMELSISDGSIALMAKAMGKDKDYDYFSKRAQNYRLYYDHSVGFFRGVKSDGSWNPIFHPLSSDKSVAKDYAEGNAWQYLWLVPQDISGLMQLMGGQDRFTARLDSMHTVTSPVTTLHIYMPWQDNHGKQQKK